MKTTAQHPDSFHSAATLASGATTVRLFRLQALAESDSKINLARLPFSLRILLENLLRREDGVTVTAEISAFWPAGTRRPSPRERLPLCRPRADAGLHRRAGGGGPGGHARRHARLGGDAEKINPLQPAELVIDHSVQVDEFGTAKPSI